MASNSTLLTYDVVAAENVPYAGTAGAGTAVVSSRRDHVHSGPSKDPVAKVWVYYNQVTNTVLASYGVSSITNNGTGDFGVNFSTAFGSVNYVPVATTNDSGSTKQTIGTQGGTLATGSCYFATRNAANTAVNLTQNTVVIFGEQ